MAKRGRPAFKATAKLKRIVEQMRAVGDTKETIARALSITLPTLEKYFFSELETGAAKRRVEVIDLLFQSARSGNVSAQKRLEQMTSVAAADEAVSQPTPDAPKQTKLGKKEQATVAAQDAGKGTDWGNDLQAPSTRPN